MTMNYWRQTAVIACTTLLLTGVAAAFWYQDWRYSLPAERPDGLQQIAFGTRVDLGRWIPPQDGTRPVLLHFFNPDCPCSKFSVDHVRQLVTAFGDKVEFVAVLQGEGTAQTLLRAFQKTGLEMRPVVDQDKEIASAMGVYSTPQAVLVAGDGRLYYRGNYNALRYCTDPKSEFARIALESLLAGAKLPAFATSATTAYGCPLPKRNARLENDGRKGAGS